MDKRWEENPGISWVNSKTGKVGIYILIVLLGAFLISMAIMFHREDPEEIYARNSNLRVEVLNGCGVNRVALRVANLLRRQGFNVVKIGDANNKSFEKTVVIERNNINMENARYFAKRISCKIIGKDIDPTLYLDVTIIIGNDYKIIFPDAEKDF